MTEYLDKKNNFISVYFFIGITILVSFLLEIFTSNLFDLSVYLPITLMVLIYWNMALPKDIGLIWAMIFGFCLDVNKEILLGSHVLLFLLISFFDTEIFSQIKGSLHDSTIIICCCRYFDLSNFFNSFFSEFRQSIFWS